MPAPAKHHDRIVKAAAALFRRNGYAATGTNDIVAASGAPKGSLYHHFPGGKAAIAAEALTYAGEVVTATLLNLVRTHATSAEAIRAYGALLAAWFARSGFQDGCPVATTLLELAPAEVNVTAAGRTVFKAWVDVFAAALARDGVEPARAGRLAQTAIAAFQGALILARVEQGAAPIDSVTDEIAALFQAASVQPNRPVT